MCVYLPVEIVKQLKATISYLELILKYTSCTQPRIEATQTHASSKEVDVFRNHIFQSYFYNYYISFTLTLFTF